MGIEVFPTLSQNMEVGYPGSILGKIRDSNTPLISASTAVNLNMKRILKWNLNKTPGFVNITFHLKLFAGTGSFQSILVTQSDTEALAAEAK
ncbi:MAG: hypothetical protein ACQEQ7_10620 [Thermodesulfobacteriota bacterium]